MSDTLDIMSDSMINKRHRFLDQISGQFHRDPLSVSNAMSTLLMGLKEARKEMPPEQWRTFCKEVAARHELYQLVQQDPFTKHSATRPRGYPGDAELLDYLYGLRKTPSTPLGDNIFDFMTKDTAASGGVRARAQIIADIIDRLAEQRGSIRVLSIACGHLREADMSNAVKQGKVKEYVAFDQDTRSLELVDKRFGGMNVKTLQGSVAEILIGKHKDLGGFDLVYAAGLYDYLSQKLATKMTTWMFNATAPGGTTLLTNFLSDISTIGYMEAFMNWELIYRTAEELADTASRIPAERIAHKKTYTEEYQTIVFVELQKAS